ncbi:DUF6541 family protein [Brachybacterium sp. AOP25-B2-12]|uniref:DUF6541 family protein n=1 Tax=Brachybacterium sp. AOP25-B2-12 TaxID=3457710 RepID=UPI0040341E58
MIAPLPGLAWLLASGSLVLVCVYVPSALALRVLGAGRLLAAALAPAVGAAGAGVAAILAAVIGVRWSLLPFAACMLALVALAAGLRALGVRLPGRASPADPEHPEHGPLIQGVPGARAWLGLAAAVALVPLAIALGRPDAVLERWDTLYHLSALRFIRDTGDGSTLHLGTISNTEGKAVAYPAAFHDLATLVPAAPIAVLLNAAATVLAVVPWVLGIGILARVLWPERRWAPLAAGIAALLAPATPVDEWIHLSAIPNLVGFAMLPGLLAAALLLWQRLLERWEDTARFPVRAALAAVLVLAAGGLGLALLQPNVAVMALLLLAVMTAVTGARRMRAHPALTIVPVLCVLPVLVITFSPLASMVTGFVGGLVVPWWTAVGEVGLGLLTIWPMAIGVVLAALWWPGLVGAWRGPARWLVPAWIVVVILYLDAAVDSSLNLSVLFYRGQDRIAMPLTMLSCLLVVPGIALWSSALSRWRASAPRAMAAVLTVAALVAAGSTVAPRLEQARLNADIDQVGRPRFLQRDEIQAWDEAAPTMDPDAVILASPFSGAAHLGAIHDQKVRFPVAGMGLTTADRHLIYSLSGSNGEVPLAQQCDLLHAQDIGYVYVDRRDYSWSSTFDQIDRIDPRLGTVVFETSHSKLLKIECTGTS